MKTQHISDNEKDGIQDEFKKHLQPDTLIRVNEPLAQKTTFRVGGVADIYIEPQTEKDLSWSISFSRQNKLPFQVMGRGSNLLIRDEGLPGLVICLSRTGFAKINVEGPQIYCGASARLRNVAIEARKNQLTGLEFVEGIPGSVGGGLRMNAGAMGSTMSEIIHSIRFMDHDGEIHEKKKEELEFQYRACALLKSHVALSAILIGQPGKIEEIDQNMKLSHLKRWDSQPAASSAGCIFKNPETIPAGKLIEELGLKGKKIGGAAVSDKHGNFIVNSGGASCRDVMELIELIQQQAMSKRGIRLETEVQILDREAMLCS
jgi:UDP-N-acetylenolpyruvoylglucosamine reductase